MRKVLLAILLLSPVLAGAEKTALNPSDYAIVVHVQSSHRSTYATQVRVSGFKNWPSSSTERSMRFEIPPPV